MSIDICDQPVDPGLLNLGVVLGESSAFGRIAGTCSAAKAALICRIHEEKLYLLTGLNWDDFCPPNLKMCRAEADKIIRLYKEFGAEYFRVSESARVSAETYRAIAPAVQDGAIHCDGEVIDLIPQNSEKVAAAVAQLRRRAAKKPADRGKSLRTLDKRCTSILAELNSFAAGNPGDPEFRQLFERVWLAIEEIRETHQL